MLQARPLLFDLLSTRTAWLSQRPAVLGQNVANADTPDFKAQDLDFTTPGPLEEFPRISSTLAFVETIEDGQLVDAEPFDARGANGRELVTVVGPPADLRAIFKRRA